MRNIILQIPFQMQFHSLPRYMRSRAPSHDHRHPRVWSTHIFIAFREDAVEPSWPVPIIAMARSRVRRLHLHLHALLQLLRARGW